MSRQTSKAAAKAFGPMAGVATLTVKIDQQLSVLVVPEGGRLDMRGRWDQIKWSHYDALAAGVGRAIAVQLKLRPNDVRMDGSILVGDKVAEPRLIVEVPLEHREAVATPMVWAAVQYVVDLVTGGAALEDDVASPDLRADAVAANDATAPEAGDPTGFGANEEEPSVAHEGITISSGGGLFDSATKDRLQSVARSVLCKVGGATLELPCSIEVEGSSCPPLEISGRCADKPAPRSSGAKRESFVCCVDGFVRSRHTVYLIDVAGNGVAREVAMRPEWERSIAVYASTRFRGRHLRATVAVERKGDKTTRELLDLVNLGAPPGPDEVG